MPHHSRLVFTLATLLCVAPALLSGQEAGEGPRLGPLEDRVTQDDLSDMNLKAARRAGLKS